MFGHPIVVATGVIGHPVENNLHAEFVGFVDHVFEFFDCTIFGVEAFVVFHRIIATELAFAIKL